MRAFDWLRDLSLVALEWEASDVHLWRASLDQPLSHVSQLARLLSGDEHRRAEGFCFEHERRRFIARRGLLRIILGCYLNTDPARVEFCCNRYGKPSIMKPTEGSTFAFSVSDSDGLALYGFARDQEIGVDIERVCPLPDADELAERFFSDSENARLRQLPQNEKLLGFFNCWTRKEAYLKATGRGLFGFMKKFSVSLAPQDPVRLSSVDGDSGEAWRWSLSALAPAPGYVAALCVETRNGVL